MLATSRKALWPLCRRAFSTSAASSSELTLHLPSEAAPACMSWGLPSAEQVASGEAADLDVFVFTHAAGLCKELWAPVWTHLQAGLADAGRRGAFLALDAVGHGDTPEDGAAGRDWPVWYLSALRSAMRTHVPWAGQGAGRVTGVGHSFGSVPLMQHAWAAGQDPAVLAALPHRPGMPSLCPMTPAFDHLVVVEPVMVPALLPPEEQHRDNALSRQAEQRRPSFPDLQAAVEYFSAKPLMSTWTPEAVQLYCQFTLLKEEVGQATANLPLYGGSVAGGQAPLLALSQADWDAPASTGPVHLKCRPGFEADCYRAYHELWHIMRAGAVDDQPALMGCTGTVLVGDQGSVFAGEDKWQVPGGHLGLFTTLASQWGVPGITHEPVRGAQHRVMPGLGHFMVQEDPAAMAGAVLDTLPVEVPPAS